MNKVLIVTPHPDDETLGCGGTILKHIAQGDKVFWLLVTGMMEQYGFSSQQIALRAEEIEAVASRYAFSAVHGLGLPTARLDTIPMSDLVERIGAVFQKVQPEIVYLPYRGDVHTDHRIVFDAAAASTKWFRYGTIKRILSYETLSETDFGLDPDSRGFHPNVFVNITNFLDTKIEIANIYRSELGNFPFPRSDRSISALAALRGTAAGYSAAEAFMLLKELL